MVIKKIELYKFKRFFLSNIEKLDYRPKSIIQMIASRNLAGKSSLLKQLNPLPADIKKDFNEDGYKYIEIEHNGKYYKLRSESKHSFICNDVEMNPGGTKKVQLELVKEHFKITPGIMDVIYNINSLTTMSPSERKHWLTEMSSVDYSYSVSIYNALRTRHRDMVGFIKFTQDDIIKSELNVMSKEDLDKLNKDRQALEDFITHIISLYDHNARKLDETYILDNINKLTTQLEVMLDKSNPEYSKSELEESINKAIGIISSCDTTISRLNKEIDSIDKIKDLGNYDDLIKKLENLKQKEDFIEKSIYIAMSNVKYNDIWEEYGSIYADVIDYCNSIIEYEDVRHMSKDDIVNYKIKHNELEMRLKAKVNKLNLYKSELEHMLKHKTEENIVQCSRCNHSWYLNYDPNKEKEYNKEIQKLQEELEEFNKEVEDSLKKLNRILDLEEMVSNFRILLKSKPILLPIWQYIFTKHSVRSCNTSDLLSELNKLSIDMNTWKDLDNIKKEISVIENNIDSIKAVQQANKDSNKNMLETLIKSLEETVAMKNDAIKTLNNCKLELQIKNDITLLHSKLYENMINLRKALKSKEILLRNEYLLELVDNLKVELVNIETILNDNNKILSNIDNNKKTLETYKVKEKVLAMMCKVLSPDEGLIAKSINGFISVIVKEMNTIINSIWTFDLEVLPCEVSDGSDLDYKFRVKVNNDQIIEDVSKLSSSGKEIVDLAFRLVFVKYMGLIDIPLFLDEFGNTFDKAHRTSAYRVIDKVLSGDYKQIFIVCHMSSIYGSFKNVDFIVLDDNNIDLDPSIETNTVMKIERG